jgi:hypothetical protein
MPKTNKSVKSKSMNINDVKSLLKKELAEYQPQNPDLKRQRELYENVKHLLKLYLNPNSYEQAKNKILPYAVASGRFGHARFTKSITSENVRNKSIKVFSTKHFKLPLWIAEQGSTFKDMFFIFERSFSPSGVQREAVRPIGREGVILQPPTEDEVSFALPAITARQSVTTNMLYLPSVPYQGGARWIWPITITPSIITGSLTIQCFLTCTSTGGNVQAKLRIYYQDGTTYENPTFAIVLNEVQTTMTFNMDGSTIPYNAVAGVELIFKNPDNLKQVRGNLVCSDVVSSGSVEYDSRNIFKGYAWNDFNSVAKNAHSYVIPTQSLWDFDASADIDNAGTIVNTIVQRNQGLSSIFSDFEPSELYECITEQSISSKCKEWGYRKMRDGAYSLNYSKNVDDMKMEPIGSNVSLSGPFAVTVTNFAKDSVSHGIVLDQFAFYSTNDQSSATISIGADIEAYQIVLSMLNRAPQVLENNKHTELIQKAYQYWTKHEKAIKSGAKTAWDIAKIAGPAIGGLLALAL